MNSLGGTLSKLQKSAWEHQKHVLYYIFEWNRKLSWLGHTQPFRSHGLQCRPARKLRWGELNDLRCATLQSWKATIQTLASLWASYRKFEGTCVMGLVKSTPTNLSLEIIRGKALFFMNKDSKSIRSITNWVQDDITRLDTDCVLLFLQYLRLAAARPGHCTRKRSQ